MSKAQEIMEGVSLYPFSEVTFQQLQDRIAAALVLPEHVWDLAEQCAGSVANEYQAKADEYNDKTNNCCVEFQARAVGARDVLDSIRLTRKS